MKDNDAKSISDWSNSELCPLNRQKLYREIMRGNLKGFRHKGGCKWYVRRSDIMEFLGENSTSVALNGKA